MRSPDSNPNSGITPRLALYSAVDDMLTHYDVDVDAATLTRRETLTMSARTQYAWPHPSLPVLYVTTSSGGPRVKSDFNHIQALAIAPDGTLGFHGEPHRLSRRAVHMCVDPTGQYALNGHNHPHSGITVHRLADDGSIDSELSQDAKLDYGIYPHQVMVFPSGRTAMLVDRGNKPQAGKAEDPGALRTFAFDGGTLSAGAVVAPNGGFGFGPRHVSFHPGKPWLYASDERTNRLYMFRCQGDRLEAEPAFTRETLQHPSQVRPRQIAGPIHVHPSGQWAYVVNRADHTVPYNGSEVFDGGENNVAVFAIDPETGEPTLVQHADTQSFHVRTFACDPSGRLLVTASIKPLSVREGDDTRRIPAALSVFRIGPQGTLEFVRKYPVETAAGKLQYWTGMVALGA
jgi:6-phosphogluconolactonase (cycloisomerase 2 family)